MPLPPARGLYDPSLERDACGLGFVADLRRPPPTTWSTKGIEILRRLAHRGAAGCDPCTSDGAGILIHIPHAHYERVLGRAGVELPNAGDYGVAQCFLSRDAEGARRRGARHRGRRPPPQPEGHRLARRAGRSRASSGPLARASMPVFRQLFIGRMCPVPAFERTLFMIRKRAGRRATEGGPPGLLHREPVVARPWSTRASRCPSGSTPSTSIFAKRRRSSKLALVHSRFSTNTFPTWERAHPYRRIAHNGEINTLRGNQTWMRAREALLAERGVRRAPRRLQAHHPPGRQRLGVARQRGRLPRRRRPQPAARDDDARPRGVGGAARDAGREARVLRVPRVARRAVGRPGGARCSPTGTYLGATLDRNGLRPMKYVVTRERLRRRGERARRRSTSKPRTSIEKGRLQPGRMLLVDLARGPHRRATRRSSARSRRRSRTRKWLEGNKIDLRVAARGVAALPPVSLDSKRRKLLRAFGYTREDLRMLLAPMAANGEEPTGAWATTRRSPS